MTEPDFWWIIKGRAALVHRKTEVTFVRISSSQSLRGISCRSPTREIPALFTSTSAPPKAPSAWRKNSRTQASSPMSPAYVRHWTPYSLRSRAASSSSLSAERRQESARLQPPAANRSATAAPIPREAPVITAHFAFILYKSLLLHIFHLFIHDLFYLHKTEIKNMDCRSGKRARDCRKPAYQEHIVPLVRRLCSF